MFKFKQEWKVVGLTPIEYYKCVLYDVAHLAGHDFYLAYCRHTANKEQNNTNHFTVFR
jgi:hypothetical protein